MTDFDSDGEKQRSHFRGDEFAGIVRELVSGQADATGKVIAELRTNHGPYWARILTEVAAIQGKATKKFPPRWQDDKVERDVQVWWATSRAIQQATAWNVAKLKADWFGDHEVWDLCCGAGGDACAIAMRGTLVAMDRDALLADFARENLMALSSPHLIDVRCGNVEMMSIPRDAWVHIDPDRRAVESASNDRTVAVDGFQPDWTFVASVIEAQPAVIVKLAPATQLAEAEQAEGSHRCWISLSGSVREQTLITGDAIELTGFRPASCSAISMSADGNWHRFEPRHLLTNDECRFEITGKPGRWMIDPDAAVRAALLTASFAADHRLSVLGQLSGFLTSDESELPIEVQQMAITGRVHWIGSADDRKLRRELRARDWFPQTIKCRGVSLDPAQLFRRYRDCGSTAVTLWIGKHGKRVYAAITDEVSTVGLPDDRLSGG